MTKKHDEKVAAEANAEAHDEEQQKVADEEKALKKAESKVSKLSKAQAAAHILEGRG